jgi:hypothetical protein
MLLEIKIKNEKDPESPFRVRVDYLEHFLSLSCTCPEGTSGLLCAHKRAVIFNETGRIHDPSEREKLARIQKWVEEVSLQRKYREFEERIQETERESRETARPYDHRINELESSRDRATRKFTNMIKSLTQDFEQMIKTGVKKDS